MYYILSNNYYHGSYYSVTTSRELERYNLILLAIQLSKCWASWPASTICSSFSSLYENWMCSQFKHPERISDLLSTTFTYSPWTRQLLLIHHQNHKQVMEIQPISSKWLIATSTLSSTPPQFDPDHLVDLFHLCNYFHSKLFPFELWWTMPMTYARLLCNLLLTSLSKWWN